MDELSKIEQRLERLRLETQKAQEAKRKAEKQRDLQKRDIVARVVLNHFAADAAFAETIRALLKNTVTNDREKAAIADLLIQSEPTSSAKAETPKPNTVESSPVESPRS